MAVLAILASRNRIMLKMGLRPIPRRLGQTVLIVIGVMLSTALHQKSWLNQKSSV